MVKHELFEYDEEKPYKLYKIYHPEEVDESLLMDHWHKEIEITYSFRGNEIHYIDGEKIINRPGRLIIVNSESVHSLTQDYSCEKNEMPMGLVLIFSYEYVKEFLPELDEIYFRNKDVDCTDELRDILQKISDYVHSQREKEDTGIYINGLLGMFFYFIKRDYAVRKEEDCIIKQQKNTALIKSMLNDIQNHYQEKITVEEFAKKYHFSTGHFSRYFKLHTGYSFSQYRMRFRVIKAKKELIETENSILEIALENGFSDSRGFINAFKKQYHMTPKQYRMKYVIKT